MGTKPVPWFWWGIKQYHIIVLHSNCSLIVELIFMIILKITKRRMPEQATLLVPSYRIITSRSRYNQIQHYHCVVYSETSALHLFYDLIYFQEQVLPRLLPPDRQRIFCTLRVPNLINISLQIVVYSNLMAIMSHFWSLKMLQTDFNLGSRGFRGMCSFLRILLKTDIPSVKLLDEITKSILDRYNHHHGPNAFCLPWGWYPALWLSLTLSRVSFSIFPFHTTLVPNLLVYTSSNAGRKLTSCAQYFLISSANGLLSKTA